MGWFDWLTGNKSAKEGIPPQSAAQVREALLALNRDSAPFLIRDGAPEGVDLVAEWKISDAAWHSVFEKAEVQSAFQVLMKFDAEKHDVRSTDHEWSVAWNAGIPALSFDAQTFKGQKNEIKIGGAYAFTETFGIGQVQNYRFNTGELKNPLKEAVTSLGWNWRGVSFGKF